jgi:hypothetical protein
MSAGPRLGFGCDWITPDAPMSSFRSGALGAETLQQ